MSKSAGLGKKKNMSLKFKLHFVDGRYRTQMF